MEDDFESSADGVPKSCRLGQHHRAGVKICGTSFHCSSVVLHFTTSLLFPTEFLVDDLGGICLPCEMLIP